MLFNGHKPFQSNLKVYDQIIKITNVRNISESEKFSAIKKFNEYGFAILRCHDLEGSRDDLCALKSLLGEATPHPRADKDGIVPINPAVEKKGFIGSTSQEHIPHTDGAYSDKPEKIISLQCVTPSTSGGYTILASAQAAHDYLSANFPSEIEKLSDENALFVERKGQSSQTPVFRRAPKDLKHLKFRCSDGSAQVKPSQPAKIAYEILYNFFTSPNNQLKFRMEKGDILIADNTALVHGRTSFPPNEVRDMRRLNFDASGSLCEYLSLGIKAGEPTSGP